MMGLLQYLPLLTLLFACKFCSCENDSLASSCGGNKLTVSTLPAVYRMIGELNSTAAHDGFYTVTINEGYSTIYGLGQCRGDVGMDGCSLCINDAVTHILQACNQTEKAQIFYDNCFLRYSTENFIGHLNSTPVITFYNTAEVKDAKNFMGVLRKLMNVTVPSEATNPGNKMLGKSQSKLSQKKNESILYGLGQCSRDLTLVDCARCLTDSAYQMTEYGACVGHTGCRIISRSCYARYELYPIPT